jgi:hypothetical protein
VAVQETRAAPAMQVMDPEAATRWVDQVLVAARQAPVAKLVAKLAKEAERDREVAAVIVRYSSSSSRTDTSRARRGR